MLVLLLLLCSLLRAVISVLCHTTDGSGSCNGAFCITVTPMHTTRMGYSGCDGHIGQELTSICYNTIYGPNQEFEERMMAQFASSGALHRSSSSKHREKKFRIDREPYVDSPRRPPLHKTICVNGGMIGRVCCCETDYCNTPSVGASIRSHCLIGLFFLLLLLFK